MGMLSESSLCHGCGGEAAGFSDFCSMCRKKGLGFCRECGSVTSRQRHATCDCEGAR